VGVPALSLFRRWEDLFQILRKEKREVPSGGRRHMEVSGPMCRRVISIVAHNYCVSLFLHSFLVRSVPSLPSFEVISEFYCTPKKQFRSKILRTTTVRVVPSYTQPNWPRKKQHLTLLSTQQHDIERKRKDVISTFISARILIFTTVD